MPKINKNNILEFPELKPNRHYESIGAVARETIPAENTPSTQKDLLIETLKDLDRVYLLADLLPPAIQKIIKNITKTLQEDTQGKIIETIEDKVTPVIVVPSNNQSPDISVVVTPIVITNDKKNVNIDMFSKDPGYKIKVKPTESLYSLAVSGYLKDDCDIKQDYASKMTDTIQKFYQTMTAIADDCGMPDYTYLMKDFDGKAVTIVDKDLSHLRDVITRFQIMRDQRQRHFAKTHTPEQTLVMQRCWLSAARQRERYLKENYKKNISSLSVAKSNTLLGESRVSSQKNYEKCMTQQYKFLDSATQFTNKVLNDQMNEAAAKAQLSATGTNIFAITPEPIPTKNNVDDGEKSTNSAQNTVDKFISSQAAGSAASYSGTGNGTVGNANGKFEQGAAAWMGQTMDHHDNGCVEAACKIGSYYSKFLLNEHNNNVCNVSVLCNDASAAGVQVISFDASQLSKGDVIVYGDEDHVTVYDGNNGYVGNSSSNDKIVHSYDYTDCGSPAKIIKTSLA